MRSIPKSIPPKNIANADGSLATGEGPFSLPDYIQLACMGNHSARMLLSIDDRRVGEVQVYKGELWTAIDSRGAGLESLRRLMFANHLHIEARPLDELKLKHRSIEINFQQALMDAARLQDEAVRDRQMRRRLSGVQESVDPDVLGELHSQSIVSARPSAYVPPSPQEAAAKRLSLVPPPRSHPTRARKPMPPPPPSRPAPPPPVVEEDPRDFEDLFEDAVEALLDRRLEKAYDLLKRANAIRDDPRVKAKLERLRDLGVGCRAADCEDDE